MKKIVTALLLTWNRYYWQDKPDFIEKWCTGYSLFTPELGCYDGYDPAVIEQQLRWLDEAGIDVVFVTINTEGFGGGWIHLNTWLNKAQQLNTRVKIAAYFNGSGNFTRPENAILTTIESMGRAGALTHPKYFQWETGRPVISGYLSKDLATSGWHLEYWLEVKEKYPQLFIIANGWHPNYWSLYSGKLDCLLPWAVAFESDNPVNGNAALYVSCCKQHQYPVKGIGVSPGTDDTAIGRTSKINRRNGDKYREDWANIKKATDHLRQTVNPDFPEPEIVFIASFNDYGEGHGIEPITASRSTTTGAFADFYLNLTKQLANAWKAPPMPLWKIGAVLFTIFAGTGAAFKLTEKR